MKKRLIESIILLLLSIAAFTSVLYALFTTSATQPIYNNITAGEETDIVLINNEYELRLNAFDRYYNSDKKVSDASYEVEGNRGQRSSLKLVNDITLSYDLIIHRDINIDLNGYTIDFNGYSIKIEHMYHGTLFIRNGFLVSDIDKPAQLIYNTPNAIIREDSLAFINVNIQFLFQNEELFVDMLFDLAALKSVYFKDIELKSSYYSSNISFSWSSSNTDVVLNNGRVITPSVNTDVIMTLELNSPDFSQAYTREYEITVCSLEDSLISYGIIELEEFFNNHRYGTNYIYLYNDMELLQRNNYYNLNYYYETELESDLEGFILKKNTVSRHIYLTATIDNNQGITYDVEYVITVVAENNLEIVNNILRDMEVLMIYNITTEIPLPTLEFLATYGVFSLPSYTLINNTFINVEEEEDFYYYIENNRLKVKNVPIYEQDISVDITFNFPANYPEVVSRNVIIHSLFASGIGGEDSADRYHALYLEVDSMLSGLTLGRTYESFEADSAIVGFGIEYSIEVPLDFPENAIEIIKNEVTNKTLFNINPIYAPIKDTLIKINYTFSGSTDVFTSYFTLPGIINNRVDGIEDEVLYEAIMLVYDTDEDGVLTLTEAEAYIQELEIDEAIEGSISTYKGIEFLKNTRKFNFNNRGFFKSDMDYLKEINGITHLSLVNCGLTASDLDMFIYLTSLVELNISDNNIINLNSLRIPISMRVLNINNSHIENIDGIYGNNYINKLYLAGNDISLFRGLLGIAELKEVYIYDNDINQSDEYGSEGKYNISTYIILLNRNVLVYNTYDMEPKSFSADDVTIELALVLESIIYYSYSNKYIAVPYKIYYNDTEFYELSWDTSNISSPTLDYSGDILYITYATGGNYELYASITKGGTTVYRIFYIYG